ncbi:hypothetical protein LCGC14_1454240 [marine sediment metagenome]|uniref:Uncharacterized protein n=1 Tax=marine sediment metagenome TaxID=412755 RepID=A0A0F9K371_9ZZZZ
MSTCSTCRRLDRGVCPSKHQPDGGCTPNTPCCCDYQYVERTEDQVKRLFAPVDEAGDEPLVVDAPVPPPSPAEAATDVDADEPTEPAETSESNTPPEGTLIDLAKFSERAVRAIEALGVTTYEELAGTPDDVIDAIEGIGAVTITEICGKLVELGFLEPPAE